MIDLPVTLTSDGRVQPPGHAAALMLGYTKNKGVYRLRITASGEWQGLTIRCCWHVPGGSDPASSLVADGLVAVPTSVTAQPGTGCITFEGSDGTKTVTSADLRYRVGANSGTENGSMPEPNTPAWEALVGTVKDETNKAQQAKTSAETAAKQSKAAAGRAESAQKAAESAKADALNIIGTSKQDALDAVQQAQNGAVKAVTDTQTTATKAVQDTATGAVTKAQTTATAAVEKKGEEVLATIPEDYTNILARVAALESCGFVVVNGKVCMKYAKT